MNHELTPEEMKCIEGFAGGDKSLRDKAIDIYRRHVREWVTGGKKGSPHLDFMSEVDSPCPDFGLRARYRFDVMFGRGA
jgi:hypothetical protein